MLRLLTIACVSLCASAVSAGDQTRAISPELQPRGVVRPSDRATLAIEFSAYVKKVHFREGETFRKGDALIEFDCRRQKAEFDSARAQHREMELTLQNNVYLRSRGALGNHEIEVSRARLAKATADAEALKLRLEQCEIKAPFAGSVVELGVQQYEMPAPGKPFLKIIKGGSPEIELIVPSNWLVWLRVGEPFDFSIEETAKSYPATIRRIATEVDPISQTVKIFGSFDQAEGVLAGMSGSAKFQNLGG